jgi:hypothetical protein
MRASEELAKRQREYPLENGGDRGAKLLAKFTPLNAPDLEAMRLSQALVVGEVGRALPNAKTFHYPDGSHAIMLFSGIIDFLDAVTKILYGSTNLHGPKSVVKAAANEEDVIRELQALFERWKPGGITDVVDPSLSMSPLGSPAADFAAMLAQAAKLFILSHEFGHVSFYRPPGEDDDPSIPPVLTRDQEFAADTLGMQTILRMAQTPSDARMHIAGVIISLRVLAVFALLGHTFPSDHPQPIDRLYAIAHSVRTFCKTERDYWSLMPIAYAFDERLTVAGYRAAHSTATLIPDDDRVFARLSAVLEAAVHGSVPHAEVVDVMRKDFDDIPPDVLERVAMTAARMFPEVPVETESPRQDTLWAEKAKLFRSLRDQWPDVAKAAFQKAFEQQSQTKG